MTKKKDPKDKKKTGRHSDYNEKEHNRMAFKLSLLGLTDKEMADVFGVSEVTLNAWKKRHPPFLKSLKAGKDMADAKVAQSLYKRALGYSHKDTDIKMYEGKVIKTEIIKQYPPDTTAGIFWLKNRQPDKWREKSEVEANLHVRDISGTGFKLTTKKD